MTEQNNISASTPRIDFDIVFYSGGINVNGYELLCEAIEKHKKFTKALLVIETSGGDPNAGFRIARALHHHYESFDAFIPRYCKSAGTLICTGASNIYMDDRSELGPLDIQVKKDDEIIGRSSGLDIVQAMNNLQTHSISTLREVLLELTTRAVLSTKVASEIACKLTTGIYEPIYAQIDPIKIAEMHRATSIAFAYGERLNEKAMNLFSDGLTNLVLSYPSHGFVIDRKEARTIFRNVHNAKDELHQFIKECFMHLIKVHELSTPMTHVTNTEILLSNEGTEEDETRDAEESSGSNAADESEVSANGENDTESISQAIAV
jgi:hypothetical protein